MALDRMITSATPQTWQALQAEVARILNECGFAVQLEKTVRTARGDVEIDVYAEETIRGRKYAIACECKHWKARIPQTVVHAFRTVVAEIGANVGYIISTAGFQSGSHKASELTNLQLVSWQEFQGLFEESWFESFFTQEIHRRLSPLMTYAEGFLPSWWDRMTEEDRQTYLVLVDQYRNFGFAMQHLGPYMRRLIQGPIPRLPLRVHGGTADSLESIPDSILDETCYRELLDTSLAHGQAALECFRVLKEKYAVEQKATRDAEVRTREPRR